MTQDQPPLPELPDESELPELPDESGLTPDAIAPAPSLTLSDQSDPVPDEFAPPPIKPPITSSVTSSNQDVLSQLPPLIKTPAIKTLRSTIRTLEELVTRLETTPVNTSPPPVWQTYQQPLQQWWTTLLNRVRAVLPDSIHRNLSDRVLGGAIAGILLIAILTTSSLLFQPSKPTPVAVLPLPSPTTAPPATTITSPISPLPPPAIAPSVAPTPAPAIAPSVAPEQERPSPAPMPDNLPDSTAGNPMVPPSPMPTVTPSPLPPPPPPLKLTPEQKLIAQIQDQVAEISNQYVNGLIQSVQANFRSSRLTVKLSNDWYSLAPLQQDQLANDMLRRAQELDFSKLELTDATGVSLARSPVVGTEMIILQRTTVAVPNAVSL